MSLKKLFFQKKKKYHKSIFFKIPWHFWIYISIHCLTWFALHTFHFSEFSDLLDLSDQSVLCWKQNYDKTSQKWTRFLSKQQSIARNKMHGFFKQVKSFKNEKIVHASYSYKKNSGLRWRLNLLIFYKNKAAESCHPVLIIFSLFQVTVNLKYQFRSKHQSLIRATL